MDPGSPELYSDLPVPRGDESKGLEGGAQQDEDLGSFTSRARGEGGKEGRREGGKEGRREGRKEERKKGRKEERRKPKVLIRTDLLACYCDVCRLD
jgi:hypothetical protein